MVLNFKQILAGIVWLLLPATAAYSVPLQSTSSVEQVAYSYALSTVQASFDNAQIMMTPLDKRLRLKACETKLEAFANNPILGLGKQTIGVKCKSPVAWTVYVPVKVIVLEPVVVALRPLAVHHVISEADIKLQSRDIGSLRKGYIKKSQQIIGQQLKYPLAMGTVISPNMLRPLKVIARGEQIMLVATAGKMEVRMSGMALSDGSLGQKVRVKNISSKRIVEGVVEGPGVVKVTM
ncbi:flagella basal body P-ring formation protein FlgA [Methylophaga sp. 41_12_T18]|nr:flagella basal body P-ring formation protein FlgA [Methylophaga sp. 41_12_T18]